MYIETIKVRVFSLIDDIYLLSSISHHRYLLPPFIDISMLPLNSLQPDKSLSESTLVTIKGFPRSETDSGQTEIQNRI